EGGVPARLLTRRWVITDANGKVKEVRGEGVVGEQPHLAPGQGFRYSSAAVLETPVGVMQGSYQMLADDGRRFEAPIAPFTLAVPGMLHCAAGGALARAVYAIGDVQGCSEEFERLLERLRFDPAHDRLWLVGDLVNRGPRSLDVLRKVQALGQAAVTVLGNHDLHLLAVALTGQRRKPQDSLDEILSAPDRDELLDWLRRRPMLHYDAQIARVMIHAGLPPQWDLPQAQNCAGELEAALRDDAGCMDLLANMYGDRPNRWSDDLRGLDRLRFITNCLT